MKASRAPGGEPPYHYQEAQAVRTFPGGISGGNHHPFWWRLRFQIGALSLVPTIRWIDHSGDERKQRSHELRLVQRLQQDLVRPARQKQGDVRWQGVARNACIYMYMWMN